jgi:hypothetical protein
MANAAGNHRGGARVDARIEDGASVAQRIGKDIVGGNFVSLGCVESNRRGGAVKLTLDQSALNDFRPRGSAFPGKRIAAIG